MEILYLLLELGSIIAFIATIAFLFYLSYVKIEQRNLSRMLDIRRLDRAIDDIEVYDWIKQTRERISNAERDGLTISEKGELLRYLDGLMTLRDFKEKSESYLATKEIHRR